MAFFTDTTPTQDRPAFFAYLAARVIGFFDRVADAQNRSLDVQRLQRLSDRELADIGIAREDIIRHVYRDIYYI